MLLIFFLSSRANPPNAPLLSQKIAAVAGHAIMYAILAGLLLLGLLDARRRPSISECIAAFSLAVVYGISDEIHQSFVPGRDAAIFDVAVDAVGAAAALMLVWFLTRGMSLGAPA